MVGVVDGHSMSLRLVNKHSNHVSLVPFFNDDAMRSFSVISVVTEVVETRNYFEFFLVARNN